MTSNTRDNLMLATLGAHVALVAWRYWPVLMADDTGRGLSH
jgi:hypothetical protein